MHARHGTLAASKIATVAVRHWRQCSLASIHGCVHANLIEKPSRFVGVISSGGSTWRVCSGPLIVFLLWDVDFDPLHNGLAQMWNIRSHRSLFWKTGLPSNIGWPHKSSLVTSCICQYPHTLLKTFLSHLVGVLSCKWSEITCKARTE